MQGGWYMSSLLNVSQVFAILLVMPNILLGPQAAGTDSSYGISLCEKSLGGLQSNLLLRVAGQTRIFSQ